MVIGLINMLQDEDDIASKQQAYQMQLNQYYQITKDGYHQNLRRYDVRTSYYLEKITRN